MYATKQIILLSYDEYQYNQDSSSRSFMCSLTILFDFSATGAKCCVAAVKCLPIHYHSAVIVFFLKIFEPIIRKFSSTCTRGESAGCVCSSIYYI